MPIIAASTSNDYSKNYSNTDHTPSLQNDSHTIQGHKEIVSDDESAVAKMIQDITSDGTHHEKYIKQVSHASDAENYFVTVGLIGTTFLIALILILLASRSKESNGHFKFQFTLSSKLIGGFSLIVTIMACLSVFAIQTMDSIGKEIEEIAEEIIPTTNAIAKIETHQLEQAIILERAFRHGEHEGEHAREKFNQEIELFHTYAKKVDIEIAEALKFLKETPARNDHEAEEMTNVINRLAKIEREHQDFDHLADKVFALLNEGKISQAQLLESYVEKAEDELNHELESLLTSQGKRSETAAKKAEDHEHHAIHILTIATSIAILSGFVIAIMLCRMIVKPVNRIITELSEGATQVNSASQQIAATSQMFAEGASNQAAGLESVSASSEEMSGMTEQNTESAQKASTLAVKARTSADAGVQSLDKMNMAINKIKNSSDETSKIIKVIDEIAFQTNLLALNAAVEAARAGEAGKGFAVVAEEVRNLAMRSAEAAKSTSSMIQDSIKNAENGVTITNEVSHAFTQIVEGIGQTADLINEIAAGSKEQSDAVSQINSAINQVESVSQSTSASAEEAASASEELNSQSESFNNIISSLTQLINGGNAENHTTNPIPSDQTYHSTPNNALEEQTTS